MALKNQREESKSPNQYQVETPASLYAGTYDRTPVKAWSDKVDKSRSESPPVPQSQTKASMNTGDVQLQDISAEEEKGTSNTSLLESDSVYIPVSPDGEMSPPRPETAPPAVNKNLPASTDPAEDVRPTTAMTIPEKTKQSSSPGSVSPQEKLQYYESRPIKPLNQEAMKSRIAAKFKSHMTPDLAQAYKSPPSENKGKSNTAEEKTNQRKRSAQSTASESDDTDMSDSSQKEDRMMRRAVRRNPEGKESTGPDNKPENRNISNLRVMTHSPSKSMYSPRVQPEKEQKPKFPTMMTGRPGFLANGFNNSQFDENNPGHQLSKAAVTIQAMWRGYLARTRNQKIIEVRQEIRARRAEDHIRYLRSELERCAINYEQEKKLRNLQLEAIKFLWREVQSLQKWRDESTGNSTSYGNNGRNGQVTLTEDDAETPVFPSVLAAEGARGRSADPQYTKLVTMCAKLQSQVAQLQETLSTVTNYVFQGSVSAGTDIEEDPIRVLADITVTPVKTKSRGAGGWEVVSNVLPEVPASPVPLPGTPTPPSDVLVSHKGETSVVVQWVSSRVLTADGKDSHRPVIGYRVYINDLPKGMVAGIKTRAFVEGLDPKAQYKIYLRAVSALGESFNSNIITVQKSLTDTPTKGARSELGRGQGSNDQKPPTSRSRQSSGGSSKGDNGSEGKGHGSDGEYRARRASGSSRRSSDAGSVKDEENGEAQKGVSTHTPKIIPPYRKLKEVTPDSDDGRDVKDSPKETPETSPVIKTHRRNRSIEKINHQTLPDKLQASTTKIGSEPHSPGSDKENINTDAGSPPGTGSELMQRPARVERQRSTSLSEDSPSRDSPNGLAKSSSHENVAKQFLRSCSPSPSDSLPHRATPIDQQSLNKLQRSITKMPELTSETGDSPEAKDVHPRITVGRSGSLKSNTKPDRYRLSPTSELLPEGVKRNKQSGSGQSSPVIHRKVEDQDKENTENLLGGSLRDTTDTSADVRERRPVTVRRSSSLKAKLLLANDPGDENFSSVHRSGSVRQRLLPDKVDLSSTTGSDSGDKSGPSSPSATQKTPENVVVKGSSSSPKSKIRSGFMSKWTSQFPPK